MMVAAGCGLGWSHGCRAASSGKDWRLEATDPADRAAAIIAAGNAGDRGAVPALVDRLEDEDSGVRFFAILALERLTGTRLDYRHGAPAAERRAAVERWREFLARGPGVRGEPPAGGDGQ